MRGDRSQSFKLMEFRVKIRIRIKIRLTETFPRMIHLKSLIQPLQLIK